MLKKHVVSGFLTILVATMALTSFGAFATPEGDAPLAETQHYEKTKFSPQVQRYVRTVTVTDDTPTLYQAPPMISVMGVQYVTIPTFDLVFTRNSPRKAKVGFFGSVPVINGTSSEGGVFFEFQHFNVGDMVEKITVSKKVFKKYPDLKLVVRALPGAIVSPLPEELEHMALESYDEGSIKVILPAEYKDVLKLEVDSGNPESTEITLR